MSTETSQPGRTGRFEPLVRPGPELTAEQRVRYARHLLLPDVGEPGQRRLAAASVAVVGAGGLGSPVLMYLAAAGVGRITVFDDDVVDASNLQRQVLHGTDDVGRPKVASAVEAMTAVNPLVAVTAHQVRLSADNAVDLLAGHDLVIDGADNFTTRYLVADATEILGIPEVWGSIFRFDGQVAVFWPGRGPVYRDLFPQAPPPGAVPSCAEGGVLGALCGVIGSAMAIEAIKLICGFGEPLVGRLALFDARTLTWQQLVVRADPARTPVTHVEPAILACDLPPQSEVEDEVTPAELAALIAAGEVERGGLVLIDVREAAEAAIVAIPGAQLVPVAGIEDGSALAQVPTEVPVILYCKSGARSARALSALRSVGRADVRHLRGGVLAWIRDQAPELPTY